MKIKTAIVLFIAAIFSFGLPNVIAAIYEGIASANLSPVTGVDTRPTDLFVTVGVTGTYIIDGIADVGIESAGGDVRGTLYVNGAVTGTGKIHYVKGTLGSTNDRLTITQTWPNVSITSGQVAEIKFLDASAGGQGTVYATNTKIVVYPVPTAGGSGSAGRDAGIKYTYSTDTTNTSVASGFLKFNAAKTALRINETDGDSNAIASFIQTWDDSNSTLHGTLTILKDTAPSNMLVFSVNGTVSDNGGWDSLGVTNVVSTGSVSNNDIVKLFYSRTGDRGNMGLQGPQGPPGGNGTGNGTGNVTVESELIEAINLTLPIIFFILALVWAESSRIYMAYLLTILAGLIAVYSVWNEIENLRVILIAAVLLVIGLSFYRYKEGKSNEN